MRRGLLVSLCLTLGLSAQQARIASDFELAQMERQLTQSRGFEAQLSGRLNLGDVRAARNELSLARAEYAKALKLAESERLAARRDSSLGRYANATSYAALAEAKLGRERRAFTLLEEAIRYASDDAETWNLYASTMRILRRPQKAVSAARNAVAFATKGLDAAVHQHALATALIEAGEEREAETLLVRVTESLRSTAFAALREEAAEQEAFEVYSSARGDVAAYVSLLNRTQLRLAWLYEKRGETAKARAEYERVLAGRSDDVTALSALARLAPTDAERERLYNEAFEANPFSPALVDAYRKHVRAQQNVTPSTDVQRALVALERGETRAARASLDALLAQSPANETLRALRREAEAAAQVALPSPQPTAAELRALLDAFDRLTSEQRVALDAATYTSDVTFEGEPGTTFASGTIDGVPFRFTEPTVFDGVFPVNARLTYRVLGVTRSGDREGLLLEPVRLEGRRGS